MEYQSIVWSPIKVLLYYWKYEKNTKMYVHGKISFLRITFVNPILSLLSHTDRNLTVYSLSTWASKELLRRSAVRNIVRKNFLSLKLEAFMRYHWIFEVRGSSVFFHLFYSININDFVSFEITVYKLWVPLEYIRNKNAVMIQVDRRKPQKCI